MTTIFSGPREFAPGGEAIALARAGEHCRSAQKAGDAFAKSRDDELQDYLSQAGVEWNQLDETARVEAEEIWRGIYSEAFRVRSRLRRGTKAEYEYQREKCVHYLIVPFSAAVTGLPVHVLGRCLGAYECRGPCVQLGTFCDVEFFICPTDYAWTMIHTHEDHALVGPYFIRAEWLA